MNKVKVCGRYGRVIVLGNTKLGKSKVGTIRVSQEREVIDPDTGWCSVKEVSALVPGYVRDLNKLNWDIGDELPGKIIFKEQMNPFCLSHPTTHLKIAGKSNVICKVDGNPIYRKAFYSPDPKAVDLLLPHNNEDEIAAAYLNTDLSVVE